MKSHFSEKICTLSIFVIHYHRNEIAHVSDAWFVIINTIISTVIFVVVRISNGVNLLGSKFTIRKTDAAS